MDNNGHKLHDDEPHGNDKPIVYDDEDKVMNVCNAMNACEEDAVKPDTKPCPFCGSEGKLDKEDFGDYYLYWVICINDDCKACLEQGDEDRDTAVERWNKRTEENT